MMLALAVCLLATAACAAAAPAPSAHYDQRQDGEMNVRADVQNIIFVVAIPQKFSIPGIFKSVKSATGGGASEAHQRTAAAGAVDAFVEPSTPYRVDITADDVTPSPARAGGGDSREVVIAARRGGPGPRAQTDPAIAWDSLKLIGALEQCGPGRARDNEGVCREHPEEAEDPEPSASPEPAPPSSSEPASSSSPSDSREDLTTVSQPISVVKI